MLLGCRNPSPGAALPQEIKATALRLTPGTGKKEERTPNRRSNFREAGTEGRSRTATETRPLPSIEKIRFPLATPLLLSKSRHGVSWARDHSARLQKFSKFQF